MKDYYESKDLAEQFNLTTRRINQCAARYNLGTKIGRSRIFSQAEADFIESRIGHPGPLPITDNEEKINA